MVISGPVESPDLSTIEYVLVMNTKAFTSRSNKRSTSTAIGLCQNDKIFKLGAEIPVLVVSEGTVTLLVNPTIGETLTKLFLSPAIFIY